MQIYLYREERVEGPFEEEAIRQASANGVLSPDVMWCEAGRDEWLPLATLVDQECSTEQPATEQLQTLAGKRGMTKKSLAVASILGCFAMLLVFTITRGLITTTLPSTTRADQKTASPSQFSSPTSKRTIPTTHETVSNQNGDSPRDTPSERDDYYNYGRFVLGPSASNEDIDAAVDDLKRRGMIIQDTYHDRKEALRVIYMAKQTFGN
jgi:hypothetical protein